MLLRFRDKPSQVASTLIVLGSEHINTKHAHHPTREMRPNHSLNRTHCGVRQKARHFILGF
jgi:hypothetical protein